MDLRQLKYFVQIAESGNVSRAAEVLRVAQPSLSQQMKSLEEELGVALLRRHPRGVTTTELGQQLYDHARRILEEADRAKELIRTGALTPSGRVSVGLPTSACRGLSLPLVEALAARQPNITLRLVEAMTGYLDDYIQAGRLDVALLYDHKAFSHVAWTEMMVEELMLFVAPETSLAAMPAIAFARLAELPLVLPGRPNVLRTVIEQFAVRHGDAELTALDCDSLPAIVKLVCRSGFATIMPHFAFTEELERGLMAAVPIVEPTPSWRLSVVVSQRTLNPRGAAAVAEVMAEVMAGMVETEAWRARLTGGKARVAV